MLNAEARSAAITLAEAVLSVRALIEPLRRPVPVSGPAALEPVLNRVASRLGAPRFQMVPTGQELGPFARIASERLALASLGPALCAVPRDAMPDVDRAVDEAIAGDFESFCRTATVTSADGTRVRAYAAGRPDAPALVLASPCGMPARLGERWIRQLAADHHVLTWESRGLFGEPCAFENFDGSTDVAAQADDLLAVMDHFGAATAHVGGLCGGAVIALRATARQPHRVSSLSLWFGDFDLGPGTPKTDHQRNLQALMGMATEARVSASAIHTVLCQSVLDSVPPDLAHLVLYPYVTPELLFRYCQLNGDIMGADVSDLLPRVSQDTLVVTSEDDRTAHPDGSRLVARAMPHARLSVVPHGDHISLFRGAPHLLGLARAFLSHADREP